MLMSTRAAATYVSGRISRGNHTFVSSEACAVSAVAADVRPVENMVQGISAA